MLRNSILVLEDNFPDFLILKDLLSDFGFTDDNFYHCYNLEELASPGIIAFAPTFIFADLNLGDSEGGLYTFQQVQKEFPSIPIVIFTGVEDDRTALACIQAGAQNFLVKGSYTPEQLLKAIQYSTERNRLKQEVEKLKADYQRIFDENPVAMLIADSKTMHFIAVNKTAIRKYGYNKEEFERLTPADLERNREGDNGRTNLINISPYTCHYRKNGEVLYIDLTSASTFYNDKECLLITATDVTDKVLAGQEEQRAKNRLEAIFNGASDAILLTDDKGRYVQVNTSASKTLGYTNEEFLSLSTKDVVAGSVSGKVHNSLWREFKKDGHQSGVIELITKEKKTLICHYNAVANIQEGLHLSIITDITERENARRKIAEQSQRIDNILESITDCFFTVDTNWIVTYWNKASEQLLHLPREKIVGQLLWNIYKDATDLKSYKEYHRAIKEQVSVHFEDYYPALAIWVDISAYPSKDGLAVYFKDITGKKNLELEILQTRNNQEGLINATNDLIWSIDKDLKLVSFNTAYKTRLERHAGMSVFAGMQLPLTDYSTGFAGTGNHYRRALRGEAFKADEMIQNPYPKDFKYAEISFNPIYDINKEEVIGVACYSRNITERKTQQLLVEEKNKDLKASEDHLTKVSAKLEKIMSSSIDIICTIDKEGKFVQVSAASLHIWGYHPEELIGTNYLQYVDQEFLIATKKAAAIIVGGTDMTNFENRHTHKNGASVPMIWSVRWDREEELLFCIAKDASAIKEAERLKAETDQRFSVLVQKSADLIGIMDEFGNYKYVSPPVKNVLGYEEAGIVGKNAIEFLHPEDAEVLASALMKMKEQEERKDQFRIRHANGEWRWVEAIATKLLDNPAIKGIVFNSRDITLQKQTETERELIIKELIKSNADLKQFSFITSHNMRAPLSNIQGILRIIDYPALDAFNAEMLEMIKVSTLQLSKTIDDLANILVIKNNVNLETGKISLEETFDEVRKIFFNRLNDICVNVETNFEVGSIVFNKTYLDSIFINLVSNAIKYRSPDRNLLISIASRHDEDGNTIVTFSDNGKGIDLHRHGERVFGLYQRFHDNTEGHGLGLFIIKSQIEALGGKIGIASQQDEGTTFTITFK